MARLQEACSSFRLGTQKREGKKRRRNKPTASRPRPRPASFRLGAAESCMLRPNLALPPPNNELSVLRSGIPPSRPTVAIEQIRNAIILFGHGHCKSQYNLARVRPQLQLGGDAAYLPITYERRYFHFLFLLSYLRFPVHCRRLNQKGREKDDNPCQHSSFFFICWIDATIHGKDGAERYGGVCLMIHLPPPRISLRTAIPLSPAAPALIRSFACYPMRCDGGLSTDKIYEGRLGDSFSCQILIQPLGAGHATIPQIKAICVPFHMGYSGLICSKRLQSGRL